MNEEEKKTFKFLKNIYKLNFKSCTLENIDIKNIVNIIEKQQDEIERLKKFEKYYENEKVVWQRKDYISKEKMRGKLEKIEELYNEKAEEEKFEYTNNQFIVDFIALVEELLEV